MTHPLHAEALADGRPCDCPECAPELWRDDPAECPGCNGAGCPLCAGFGTVARSLRETVLSVRTAKVEAIIKAERCGS